MWWSRPQPPRVWQIPHSWSPCWALFQAIAQGDAWSARARMGRLSAFLRREAAPRLQPSLPRTLSARPRFGSCSYAVWSLSVSSWTWSVKVRPCGSVALCHLDSRRRLRFHRALAWVRRSVGASLSPASYLWISLFSHGSSGLPSFGWPLPTFTPPPALRSFGDARPPVFGRVPASLPTAVPVLVCLDCPCLVFLQLFHLARVGL